MKETVFRPEKSALTLNETFADSFRIILEHTILISLWQNTSSQFEHEIKRLSMLQTFLYVYIL